MEISDEYSLCLCSFHNHTPPLFFFASVSVHPPLSYISFRINLCSLDTSAFLATFIYPVYYIPLNRGLCRWLRADVSCFSFAVGRKKKKQGKIDIMPISRPNAAFTLIYVCVTVSSFTASFPLLQHSPPPSSLLSVLLPCLCRNLLPSLTSVPFPLSICCFPVSALTLSLHLPLSPYPRSLCSHPSTLPLSRPCLPLTPSPFAPISVLVPCPHPVPSPSPSPYPLSLCSHLCSLPLSPPCTVSLHIPLPNVT